MIVWFVLVCASRRRQFSSYRRLRNYWFMYVWPAWSIQRWQEYACTIVGGYKWTPCFTLSRSTVLLDSGHNSLTVSSSR